jgi:hypothetical protein
MTSRARPVAKNSSSANRETETRVQFLLSEAERFCTAIGLHKHMMEIYSADNDWTFALKIDALLETATKEIIKSGLRLKVLNRFVGAKDLANSLTAYRRVRNVYAHNIKLAELSLIDVINRLPDKSTFDADFSHPVQPPSRTGARGRESGTASGA